MLIFYFSYINPRGKPDAALRHTSEICNHLALIGNKIKLFVPLRNCSEVEFNRNVSVIYVPVIKCNKELLVSLSYYLFVPIIALKYFVALKPNIIYTRSSFLDCISIAPLKLLFKFSFVAELNGIRSIETTGSRVKKTVIKVLEGLTLRLSNKVVSVTPELGRWVKKTVPVQKKDILISSNGVNTEIFYPLPKYSVRKRLGLDPAKFYITFTSSLKSWHGTEVLLNAIKCIAKNAKADFKLLIVGDGPEKIKNEQLVKKLKIHDYVKWVGKVSFEHMPLYINAGDFCIAPFAGRRNQTVGLSPLKIYEYMSCGKAFVTTRVNAAYDQIMENWGCSLLVEPDNPNQLADSILKLIEDEDLRHRLGEKGLMIAKNQFSWSIIAKQINNFIIPFK